MNNFFLTAFPLLFYIFEKLNKDGETIDEERLRNLEEGDFIDVSNGKFTAEYKLHSKKISELGKTQYSFHRYENGKKCDGEYSQEITGPRAIKNTLKELSKSHVVCPNDYIRHKFRIQVNDIKKTHKKIWKGDEIDEIHKHYYVYWRFYQANKEELEIQCDEIILKNVIEMMQRKDKEIKRKRGKKGLQIDHICPLSFLNFYAIFVRIQKIISNMENFNPEINDELKVLNDLVDIFVSSENLQAIDDVYGDKIEGKPLVEERIEVLKEYCEKYEQYNLKQYLCGKCELKN